MLKLLKKFMVSLMEWIPFFFCLGLFYWTPSLYIREISLFISRKNFIIIIQIVLSLWVLYSSIDEYKPYIWKVINILIPIELICFLFFLQYHFKSALAIIAFWGVINLFFFYVLRKNMQAKSLTRRQWHNYKNICKRFSSLSVILLFSIPTLLSVFKYGLRQPYSVAAVSKEIFSQTSFETLTDQNESTLQNLLDSKWEKLSYEEKMNTLQIILNIETTYLTINPITLKSTKLETNTIGQYLYDENTIYIDSDILETCAPLTALDVICHECRHAYQHYVVNMLDWSQDSVNSHYFYRQAKQWKLELEDYTDGYRNYDLYYQQNIEIDARDYAKKSVKAYQAQIDELNGY